MVTAVDQLGTVALLTRAADLAEKAADAVTEAQG